MEKMSTQLATAFLDCNKTWSLVSNSSYILVRVLFVLFVPFVLLVVLVVVVVTGVKQSHILSIALSFFIDSV